MGCDDKNVMLNRYSVFISIHAPIVGCDTGTYYVYNADNDISIHAPIVGCDFRKKDT